MAKGTARDARPVAVEPGSRAFARSKEQTSIQYDEALGDLLRLMKDNTSRSIGDILREAIEHGLPKVAGYTEAKADYARGRRIARPVSGALSSRSE